MTRRIGWMMALAALVVVPPRAPAAEPTPTVVLRIRPLETILEDVKYLAEMVGQKDTFALVEGQIAQVPGIDMKKPLGAYAYVSPGIVDSGFAVMVPVKSEKEILDLLGAFGMNPDKDADGVYTLNLPPQVPFPAHFRFTDGYMYVTVRDKSALSKDTMIPPAKVFAGAQTDLVDFSVRLDKIPDQVRQLVVTQLELNLPQILELQKVPGETEAQAKMRTAMMKQFAEGFTMVLKDAREIKLQFDLDRKKHSLALQFSLDSTPNSELAKTIAGMGMTLSPTAGLYSPDAAASISYNMGTPEGLIKVAVAGMREEMLKNLEKEPDAGKKALGSRIVNLMEMALKDAYQSTMTLRGPSANGQFVGIAGLKIADAATLEKAIRDLVKDLPADVRSLVQLDHAKAGSVTIHRVQIPQAPNTADMKRVFGESSVYVALAPGVGFIAIGQDGVAEIKKALALKPMAAPPARAEFSLARLMALAEGDNKFPAAAVARKVFQGADKDADRIRITLEGGAALKFRIEARTQLLKFLLGAGGVVP